MSIRKQARLGGLLAAAIALGLVVTFALGYSQAGTSQAAAHGAMAVDCDATQGGVQSDCTYAPGSSFDIEIHVTAAPEGGYGLFQAKTAWTKGVLNYLPTADPGAEALWGPCTLAGRINNWELTGDPSVFFSCNPFPAATVGDTTTGAVLTFEFQCKTEFSPPDGMSPPNGTGGNQSVLHLVPSGDPQGGTVFGDLDLQPIVPALTDASVTCSGEPPPPTDTPIPPGPTATPVPPMPTATPVPPPPTDFAECVDVVFLDGTTAEGCIDLEPETDSNPVGTEHTLTATVTKDGEPSEGEPVAIWVFDGPNAGEFVEGVTDASGQVVLTYTGDGGPGTDTIFACLSDEVFFCFFFGDPPTTAIADEVTKDWFEPELPGVGPGPAGEVSLTGGETVIDVGEDTVLTFTVVDDAGNTVPDVDCAFSIVGPEGTDASLSSDSGTTDANGDVSVTLTAGSNPETVQVKADCGDFGSFVQDVTVSPALPTTGAALEADGGFGVGLWAMIGALLVAAAAGPALFARRSVRAR